MIGFVGSVGWGLLACGAITHVWHHQHLRRLLSMHVDHERLPAAALTAIEVSLVVGTAIAYLSGHRLVSWLAAAAFLLAIGFVAWIARLLVTHSDLPCACSFSESPTSVWSLLRAGCVCFVGAFMFLDPSASSGDLATRVATLMVGWSLASAIFVLPEALGWPDASRALMARVDAHVHATS